MSAGTGWPSAQELGFARFPAERYPDLRRVRRVLGWVPGMRVEPDTYYLICWHAHDLSTYREAGGTMDRCLVHHLSYDTGLIDPLWGSNTFQKRVTKMRAANVGLLVAPDFSSWANYPVVVQMYNYYRSMRVSCDLSTAGFTVVPMVCWSAPQIAPLSIGMWPTPMPACVVDASHLGTGRIEYNQTLFWKGARVFHELLHPERVLLWAGSEATHRAWLKLFPEDKDVCVWAPTRAYMLRQLMTRVRRSGRAAKV